MPLTYCVALGRFLNFSEPQLLLYKMELLGITWQLFTEPLVCARCWGSTVLRLMWSSGKGGCGADNSG